MPFVKIRKVGKRRVVVAKYQSKYRARLRAMPRNNKGYLKIVRKCPEFWLQNSPTTGQARLAWTTGGTTGEVSYTGTNCVLGTIQSGMNGAADIPFAMNFRLSDVINYSDIATLADKYRIKSIYLRLIPNFTQNSINGIYSYPSVSYVVDDDDAAAPTVAQLREKMGVKVKTFKPGQYVGIKLRYPKIQATVQDATGTANAQMQGGRWLDCQNVNIPHYAIKGVISNMDLPSVANAKIAIKFDLAYVLEAKDFQ